MPVDRPPTAPRRRPRPWRRSCSPAASSCRSRWSRCAPPRWTFFRNLGPVLAITVLIAMVVCLVFVPALLALLGRAAVWPSHTPAARAGEGRRLRERFAYGAAGRPGALAISIVCLAVLGVGAYQAFHMRVGIDAISGLPASSEARSAADAAGRGLAGRGSWGRSRSMSRAATTRRSTRSAWRGSSTRSARSRATPESPARPTSRLRAGPASSSRPTGEPPAT